MGGSKRYSIYEQQQESMQLTARDSDLLWKNISDFTMQSDSFSLYTFCLHELKHLSIIIPFSLFVAIMWCHTSKSEVVSFSDNLDLNSSPQGEVVCFQTTGFHGCTLTCDPTSKAF